MRVELTVLRWRSVNIKCEHENEEELDALFFLILDTKGAN